MSFFEDLGKKISSAGKEAIAKTKDFADIAKLNSSVSDEERRINSAYEEIGKMYVELHSEDFEGCFEPQFLIIKEAKERIKDYEKQIIDIKGVVKCPGCGAEVSGDASFCSVCGTAIPHDADEADTQAEEGKKCPVCGADIDDGVVFCMKCGTKIEQ